MTGIYSYNTPLRLFEKLARSFAAFCASPSEDGIFEVIFPFYHLREWICPGKYDSYKHKSNNELTREEHLHNYLYSMPEYKIVQALCNNAKHYSAINLTDRTEVLEGFRAGLGRAGDSLGVAHFMVDGKEIRDVFWPVYEVYFDYFKEA